MSKMRWACTLLCLACEARTIDHGIGEVEMDFAQDAATAYCEVVFACDCEQLPHADVTSCIEQESAYIADVQRRGQEAGLGFDTECAAFTIGRWRDIGCDDFFAAALRLRPPNSSEIFPQCRLYYGSVPDGEQCETAFGTIWNDCEQGSDCVDAGERGFRCEPAPPFETEPPGLDEPCVGGEPVAQWSCEAPLYCFGPQMEATCRPYVGEGERCDAAPCEEGLLCDLGASNTCRQPLTEGAACSSVGFLYCAKGLFCDLGGDLEATDGVCAPRLEPGAACTQYDSCRDGDCECQGDMTCDGVCVYEGPSTQPPALPIFCEWGTRYSPREVF